MNNKRAKLISAGGMFDHIHLYTSLPSTISVGDFVNAVKSNSSRWIHKSFSRLRNFAWQEGYGAFSVSKSEQHRVVKYIREQEKHHGKRTFKQELIALLRKHEIDYDETLPLGLKPGLMSHLRRSPFLCQTSHALTGVAIN
jgi:putative transposase